MGVPVIQTVPTPRRLTIQVGLQLFVRLGGLVSGVLGLAVLARGLSVEDFANFTLCLTVLGLATTATELGLTSAATREYSTAVLPRHAIAGALVSARILSSTIGFLVGFFALWLSFGGDFWSPGLLIIGTLALSVLTAGQAWAQADLRVGLQNLLLLLQSWCWPLLALAVFALSGGAASYAWAFWAAAAGYAVISYWVYRGAGVRPEIRGSWPVLKDLLRQAVPYALASIFIAAYYRLAGILVYRMGGQEESADFNAAFRIFEPLQTIPATALAVLLPLLARTFRPTYEGGSGSRQRLFSMAIRFALISSLPIAAGGSLIADRLLTTLLGDRFAGAAEVFEVLVWAFPPICLGYVLLGTSIAAARTRPITAIAACVAVINTAVCILVIPASGAAGAAWITVATEWTIALAVTIVLRRTVDLHPPWTDVVRVAAATVVMSIALIPVRTDHLAVSISVGGLAYCIASVAVRSVSQRDLTVLFGTPRHQSGGPR